MAIFYDTKLLDVLEELTNDLIDAEIKYKASLDINSVDKKATATLQNYAVRVVITRKSRKLIYAATDLGKMYHAQKEGFSTEEIERDIKCHFVVTRKLAKVLLLNPGLLATITKESLEESQTSIYEK
jgi:hypothetical protein